MLLCTQTNDLGEKLKRDSDILSPSLENGPVDEPLLLAFFQNTVDFLRNAYFIKISLNRIGVNHAEELESEGVPTEMENIISEVNAVVKAAKEMKFVALAQWKIPLFAAHNPEVVGSSPASATIEITRYLL